MSTPAVVKAKRFLVNRIVDQAKRANLPLTEVEARMLGFSSASANPAELDAAATFDRDYDKEKFESKVSSLFQDVYLMDKSMGRTEVWEQSLDALADEDMYLAVIIRKTGMRKQPVPWYLPELRSMRQFVPAIVMVAAGIVIEFTPLGARLIHDPISRFVVTLCFWLSPWLISKLGKASDSEEPSDTEEKE
jgi:hypothetical protein